MENRGKLGRPFCLPCLLALALACFSGTLEARYPALAVISEDLSGETDSGGLEMVESLAEAGVMETDGVSLVSRRHLEKILGDIPAASAILDRLLHRSDIIAITGPSYRLHQSTAHHLAATAAATTPKNLPTSPA